MIDNKCRGQSWSSRPFHAQTGRRDGPGTGLRKRAPAGALSDQAL